MDDDPDPTLDQVILEGSEMNEQIISVGELQKCNLEGSEENSVHQESGDNGPFLEQEVTKRTTSGKDAPDLTLQTNSNVSIFKRKEQVDQSQTPDAAGSMKRKPSRRSLQWSPSQDSHPNNQQTVGQQVPISQKTSCIQLVSEVDSKETTWINKKTGKIMSCRGQQTSASWERRILSEILHCSSEISAKSKGTSSEEDSTSTVTTLPESSESDGHQNSLDKERNSIADHISKQKSRSSSQESSEESSLLIPKRIDSEEEIPWLSPKTGKEMKNKTQQTSILWELKTLSEILRSSSQENFTQPIDTDTIEDTITSSGVTEVEQSDFRQDIQQPEESKIEPSIKKETYKYDQSQQTDSVATLKKELLDYSQQTDSFTDSSRASIDLKDSYHSTQQLEAQQSRHGSQDSQRTVQNLLELASQERVGKQSEVLASLTPEQNQEPVVTGELDENTWISKKTGKVVKNQPQQTDKSWLQYCAVKKQKVKKCSSQQTDESFLQWYAVNKMTMPSREDLVKDNGQQRLRKFSSVCHELDTQFSDWDMSPVGQDATRRKTSNVYEPEGPTDRTSVTEAQWPDESESRSTVSGSTIAEEDTGQQTYSIISLEDGIWLNRRTGKILISHSQQTSQTAISTTSLQKAGSGVREEELQSPGTGKDESNAEQGKANMDGQQPAGKESHCSSQAKPDYDTQAIPAEPFGEKPQSNDEVEKLLSTRLSEAMLLSAESLDMEDEPVDLYTPVKEGSWMNLNTGMVLNSQTQQTEEDAKKFLEVDDQLPGDTFQQTPEILASGNSGVQSCAGEGMDDDPIIDDNESVLDSQTLNAGI